MATEAQTKKALAEHAERLGRLPNVVALGVVPADDEEPPEGGALSLAVYVRRAADEARLPEEQRVPAFVEISDESSSRPTRVPTKVVETGDFQLG